MIHVIGFEGEWPATSPAAWGAAAVEHDGWVRNSISGQQTRADELRTSRSESIWSFDPIELREEYRDAPLVVVGVRATAEGAPYRADTGRLGGLVRHKRSKGCIYYVFKDRAAFDSYADDVAANVVAALLQASPAPTNAMQVATNALIVAPHNPFLHALRVTFSEAPERSLELARLNMLTSDDKVGLDLLVAACSSRPVDYWLKYQEGIAAGGGLAADVAARQFAAIDVAHRRIRPVVAKRYAFLDTGADPPSFRIRRLEAASADINLGVDVAGEPLINRVGRYFEIQMLQEVLRGRVPDELESDAEFLAAVETIVHPTEDTLLSQRPIDAENDEPVVFERFVDKDAKPDESVTVIGYVQGISREVGAVEIRIFPNVRELVSLENNGHGGEPEGVDVFHKRNDFLFWPCVFALQRFVDTRGRHKFFLQKLLLLDVDGHWSVDAIPCSVVAGAFLRLPSLAVRVAGGDVLVDGAPIRLSNDPLNVHQARRWLERYADWCRERERDRAAHGLGVWVRAVRPKPPSAIMRILLTLEELGGAALIPDLIAAMNEKYETSLRRNNTRREIRANPGLVVHDAEDDDRVELTMQGRLCVKIYNEACVLAPVPTT